MTMPAQTSGLETSTKSAKVAVVGSIHMDFINFVVDHPPLGGHVQSKNSVRAPGGHGANQAVACARLSALPHAFLMFEDSANHQLPEPESGLEVFLFGAIGDDSHASAVKTELKRNRINMDGVVTIEGEDTGYAHVNVSDNGEAIVTSNRGASKKFLPGTFFNPSITADVVLVQLEIPMEMVLHALAWAKQQRAMIVCNAAPATRTLPDEIFNVDHFIVNEQQADTLNGFHERLFPDRIGQRNKIKIRQHYQELCEKFHDNGATCVVITMAELGVVGSRRDQVTRIQQQYIFDAEQGTETVKDTTGASDTFIGGYTVALVQQKQAGLRQDIASAIRLGIKAAGLCVSRAGSMPAIPFPEEIMETTFRAAGS